MATTTPWWVPVAGVADLRAAPPWAARAFGEDLVLWRASGAAPNPQSPLSPLSPPGPPSVFVDRCPHRGARLSRGRVDAATGTLECPYHGWRFEHGGRCIAIPALPDFTPPATHRACAWQATEAHGLVWVAAAGAPPAAPHTPDALHGLPARRVLCGPFDVAASAPRVVENFLDTAHFGFVHEGSLGSREQLAVPHYDVVHDEHGRPGVPLYRAWQPRATSTAQGGTWVNYRYQLLGPWSALLTKQAEADGAPAEAYALWGCPLDEEHTRVWFTICTSEREDAGGPGDDALRAFQAAVFAEDAPVLESQRPVRLPLQPAAGEGELHCAADRLSVAYRRWLLETGARYGTC